MRPVRSHDDQDAFTGWRRVVKRMGKAGVRAAIKRRYRRWERRAGADALAEHEPSMRDIRREVGDTMRAREYWGAP